ncbi:MULTISPECIES: hypothetical protein [Thiothrix]|jgi:hypothetical protein|uniref:Uncharacterized protein n=1 Tax=Candidatus Thiothrix anitrata TaxID=2823902 RepID=A0ABX7WXW4_9GAMM|nr:MULTISPECIES: hypothetical protein [Thiothrix]QTR48609.1 hypothetical protein J8380_09850 [Candidatus Thiothrix anitrata]
MNWLNWLTKWKMTKLQINAHFLQLSVEFKDADRNAAWEMYIELLTRITTQALDSKTGDEATALKSIHSLFPTTRDIIKKNGRDSFEFTKLAIVVLNQIIRPFTAKWHKLSIEKAFENDAQCAIFRAELAALQADLRIYTGMLGEMAGVEDDLVLLEQVGSETA